MADLDTLRRIGADTPIDHDALARARARLVLAIDGDNPMTQVRVRKHRARRVRRVAVAAGMIAALTAGGVVAATIGSDRPGDPSSPVAAAGAAVYLREAAAASLIDHEPVPKPGQYRRIARTGLALAMVAAEDGQMAPAWLSRATLTVWIPSDRSQTWVLKRTDNTPVKALNAAGEKHLMTDPQQPTTEHLKAVGGTFYSGDGQASPWGEPWSGYYDSLPTEPDALRHKLTQLNAENGSMSDAQMFEAVRDALVTGMVPAKLRSAMYQVLISLPQVTLTQQSANLNGRKGVAVGIVRNGIRDEIIFNPKTGQVIGDRSVVVESPSDLGIAAGTLIGSTAMTDEIVNSVR